MKFLNKKILLPTVIIVVFIIAVAIGAFFYWQKTHTPEDISLIDTSSEEIKAKCLENVSKMDDKQIIGKINTLPFASHEDLKKINSLMSRHLHCQFLRNPFEEQYAEIKLLVESLKISEEAKLRSLARLDPYLSSASENSEGVRRRISHPSFKMVVYDTEMLCLDGEERPEIVEELIEMAITESGHSRERAESVMGDYCTQINKYLEDKSSLVSEVYEFKDWPEDLKERQLEYRWKVILASRFGGEAKAKQVCNNLFNESEKEDCQGRVRSINGWPTPVIREKCMGAELKEVIDSICELETTKSQ